jgi:hypothetical protein
LGVTLYKDRAHFKNRANTKTQGLVIERERGRERERKRE